MNRPDHRAALQLRPVEVIRDYLSVPEGSVLFSMGNTKVLCNVTIENKLPPWIAAEEKGIGWITAEYSMLPRSTQTRNSRETSGLRGRTQEIKRLIGRSLRAAFDLEKLGERTCIVDCDVLQADGGTRTASITGGYIALRIALQELCRRGELRDEVFLPQVAAVSAGILNQEVCLDLCYREDASAEVDLNVVMTEKGQIVEIQGTAEHGAFSRQSLNEMLDSAQIGLAELFDIQRKYWQ